MGKINILTAGKDYAPVPNEKILFLAGPTTRRTVPTDEFTQWRQDAIDILISLDFEGTVCVPEPYTGAHNGQVIWEQEWLRNATTIIKIFLIIL